jgi:hypothetical protein
MADVPQGSTFLLKTDFGSCCCRKRHQLQFAFYDTCGVTENGSERRPYNLKDIFAASMEFFKNTFVICELVFTSCAVRTAKYKSCVGIRISMLWSHYNAFDPLVWSIE